MISVQCFLRFRLWKKTEFCWESLKKYSSKTAILKMPTTWLKLFLFFLRQKLKTGSISFQACPQIRGWFDLLNIYVESGYRVSSRMLFAAVRHPSVEPFQSGYVYDFKFLICFSEKFVLSVYLVPDRTNNYIESYHRYLMRHMGGGSHGGAYPNTWTFWVSYKLLIQIFMTVQINSRCGIYLLLWKSTQFC